MNHHKRRLDINNMYNGIDMIQTVTRENPSITIHVAIFLLTVRVTKTKLQKNWSFHHWRTFSTVIKKQRSISKAHSNPRIILEDDSKTHQNFLNIKLRNFSEHKMTWAMIIHVYTWNTKNSIRTHVMRFFFWHRTRKQPLCPFTIQTWSRTKRYNLCCSSSCPSMLYNTMSYFDDVRYGFHPPATASAL